MQGVEVLREQTKQFIAEDPTSVVLSRNTKAEDGAGGSTFTPAPLPSQVVKVAQRSESSSVERRTESGEVVRPGITLVCEWDADIQRGDTFEWEGLNVEIVWVTALDYVKHGEGAAR